MEQIGYSLIDRDGNELRFWGDTPKQCVGFPSDVVLPNGDIVCGYQVDWVGDWKFVPRMLVEDNEAASSIVFDGTQIVVTRPEPIPGSISDRQFFQVLAMRGAITESEAIAAVSTGTIPAALETFVLSLPQGDQFSARMLLQGAVEFRRDHPLVPAVAVAFNWTDAQLDQLWRDGAAL